MTCGMTKLAGLLVLAAVTLVAPSAGALEILVADDLYSGEPTESLDFLIDLLGDEGHDVTVLPNTDSVNRPLLTNDLDYLLNYDAVIFYKSGIDHLGRLLTVAEYDALLTYVEAGGNLVVTGPNLLFAPEGDDDLAADLIGSAIFGGTLDADFWITADDDNWLLKGPYGDLRDLELQMVAVTTHDKMLADQGLGAFSAGSVGSSGFDKVIYSYFPVPGGAVMAWTGNYFGDDWYPGQADGDTGLLVLLNFLVDDDSDAVLDGIDNCADVFNPHQDDSDDDGIGDACDETVVVQPTIVCGLGAAQAFLPILLGLGLMKMGVTRIRRDRVGMA